jgi:biotin carboxylase
MKALVLAGGYPQIALINEIKSRGIAVVLADYYENPVAKPYADIFYRESTLDVEAIERVAKQEKVDFLITACTDQALLTVALVSEKLGLPCYIDYKTALNVTNKEYMKKVFVAHCIPTAKYVIMHGFDPRAVKHLKYPLIVKPVDCNSSKGVRKVQNEGELKVALVAAVKYSRTDTAVIEEFIEGPEISVDAYIENGVAYVLSVSKSDKITDKEKLVIFRGNYPAEGLNDVRDQIQTTVQQIANAFGLINTPMLVQMINTGNKVYVLEFSARTGGGVKYVMIKKASGFDVIKAVVDLTLGLKPHVGDLVEESKYLSNEFIYCSNGVFDHLEGFDELKAEGIITDYYLFKWKGAVMDGVANSGDRIAGFTIQADTKLEMNRKHNQVTNRIRIIDTNGNDIMRHDLLSELYADEN